MCSFLLRKNRVILFSLLGAPFGAFSQQLSEDLRQLMHAADAADAFSIESSIHVYSSRGGAEVYDTRASLDRTGNASVTKMGDLEIFENIDYYVSVDHNEKEVAILSKKKLNEQRKPQITGLDLKSISKLLEKPEQGKAPAAELLSDKSGLRSYVIRDSGPYKEVRITLDITQKELKSVSFEYKTDSPQQGQYVVVDYNRFSIGATANKVAASNYFTISDKKYKLVSRLAGYTLITEL